jgi:hypothetical protein
MERNNEKRIALWYNERRTVENQPHLTGQVEINGKKYNVSLWLQTSPGKDMPDDVGLREDSIRALQKLHAVKGKAPILKGLVSIPHSKPNDDIPFR